MVTFRFKIIAVISFLVFLLVAAGCTSQEKEDSGNDNANTKVEQIIADISSDSIKANIQQLAAFNTRHTTSKTNSDSTGIGAAQQWIYESLQRYNNQAENRLKIKYDRFTEADHPQLDTPTEIVNVVAVLPGTQLESKDRRYMVSTHYDSRASNAMDSTSDSVSGTALLMELARVMANYEFDATIVFVAFSGNEQGLLGATHYAEQAFLKNRNIAAVLNNDMVGKSSGSATNSHKVRVFTEGIPANIKLNRYHQTLLNTGGENDTPSRQLGRFMHQVGEEYVDDLTVNMIYRRDRFWKKSDHIPFLEKSYPAVRISQWRNDSPQSNQDERTQEGKDDLLEFFDVDYVQKVAKLNASTVATLADAPARPNNVKVMVNEQSDTTTLQWKANKEPDLKGYKIMWRHSAEPYWQHSRFVGDTLETTIEEFSKNNYIFGVKSVDGFGNESPAVYPTPSM